MTRLGLRGRVLAAAATAAALIAAGFALLIWSVLAYRDAAASIRLSEASIARAVTLEKLLLDLETGQRGFVLTGQAGFLDPWEEARVALPRAARAFAEEDGDEEDAVVARPIAALALGYLRDYSIPVVEVARTDLPTARRRVASGEGKQRVDSLREAFDVFVAREQEEADERRAEADRLGEVAVVAGAVGLAATLLILAGLYAYVRRAVLLPVGGLAAATRRLGAGELGARVADVGRQDEVGALAVSFNRMAGSLEDSHAELEAQNAALEAQQVELEQALDELARERDRVVALNRFAGRLAREVEVEALALALIEELGEAGRSELGAVYVAGGEEQDGLRLAASRGLHPELLDPELERDGPAARAVDGRAPVAAAHDAGRAVAGAWAEGVAVRHELHVPLVQAGRVLGVVSLARRDDRVYTAEERSVLQTMAGQGAVALSNALALRRVRREVSITRAMLDASPDAIGFADPEGFDVLANAPMVQFSRGLVGVSPTGDVYERLRAAAALMVDPEASRAAVEDVVAHPDRVFSHEYTVAATNRSFHRYVAPVHDSAGALVGRLFVVRETTEAREAERLKDELIATVSHELRTPLTSIIGYLELLLSEEDGAFTDEQRRFLDVVDRNARRLLAVVGDLLFVAQVEAGRLQLERVPVDLARLAGEAAESQRPLAAGKGVELDVDADPGLVVDGDATRLGQLLGNLVSNAIKFTPERGRVDVRVHAVGDTALVEVADTGIGIPEEEQPKLFQRFFRTSAAAQSAIQGTGLGLVIAKAIAEAHGGTIGFTSMPGAGTTFRVEIPIGDRAVREEVHVV